MFSRVVAEHVDRPLIVVLTLFLLQYSEGLHQLMFGTLHHPQPGLCFILKRSEDNGKKNKWMKVQTNFGNNKISKLGKRCYLRVKGMVSKRLSISLKNVRDVFIFKPYTLLGSRL